jgi:hypothetical protein
MRGGVDQAVSHPSKPNRRVEELVEAHDYYEQARDNGIPTASIRFATDRLGRESGLCRGVFLVHGIGF